MLYRLGVLSHLGFCFFKLLGVWLHTTEDLGERLIKTFSAPSAQFNIYSLPLCYRLCTVFFLPRDRQMSSCLCHMPGTILNNLPFHGGGGVMERSRKLPCSAGIELPLPSILPIHITLTRPGFCLSAWFFKLSPSLETCTFPIPLTVKVRWVDSQEGWS